VQVAEAVQQRAGRSALSRNAAYDLAKLKGKKLGPFPDFTGKGRFALRTASRDRSESG
jgi:hypothetical protein